MNYTWSGSREYAPEGRRVLLDYSRHNLPELLEYHLDESAGMQGDLDQAGIFVPVFVTAPGMVGPCGAGPLPPSTLGRCMVNYDSNTCINYALMVGAVDWNNDGIISPSSTPVCADPNRDGDVADLGGGLMAVDEWSLIDYNFRESPDFADEVIADDPDPCPTVEMEQFMSSLPAPLPPCPADPPQAGTPSPATATWCGGTVQFAVEPSGAGPFRVQWRRLDPTQSAWVDLVDGVMPQGTVILGSREGTLRVLGADRTELGGSSVQFSYRLTDVCDQSVESPAATMLIGRPQVTSTTPQFNTVCPGGSYTLSVSATSAAEPLSYSWLCAALSPGTGELTDGTLPGGTVVQGAYAGELTFSNVNPADFALNSSQRAYIECRVSDACAGYQSRDFWLTVNGVDVYNFSGDQNLPCDGSVPVMLSASAVGTDLTYQWLRDGVALVDDGRVSGANSPALTITSPVTTDSGEYVARVSSTCGSVDSFPFPLTVGPPMFTQQPHVRACSPDFLLLETAAVGTRPLNYRWTRDGVDLVNDGELVFGATETVLFISRSLMGTFGVRAMNACATVVSDPLVVPNYTAPGILEHPASTVVCPGGTAILSVSADPPEVPYSYVWEFEDPANPGNWMRLSNEPLDFGSGTCASAANTSSRTISLAMSPDPGASCPRTLRVRAKVIICDQTTVSNTADVTVCRADFNCSGVVSVQDIFDFLGAYFTGDASADVNGSGGVSVQDIFDFLAIYFQPCD
jgi:hypothetical protein